MNEGKERDEDVLILSQLDELRFRLKDLNGSSDWSMRLETDFYLLEWLKSKRMDVKKTEKALRKCFNWRMENGIVNPVEDFPEDVAFRLPIYEDASTHDGIPIYAVSMKNWRVQSLVQAEGKEKLIRYVNLMLLKIEDKWIQHNSIQIKEKTIEFRNPHHFTCLIDCKDYPTNQVVPRKIESELKKNLEKYFPPIVQRAIVINVPPVIYSMKDTFTPSKLIDVSIFNCDDAKWKKVIQEIVPLQKLPIGFGGI